MQGIPCKKIAKHNTVNIIARSGMPLEIEYKKG
jgi:hypothetical protein